MAEATLAFNILTKYKDRGANQASRDMDKLGKSSSRTSGALKKVGAAAAIGLGAGLVVGAKAMVDMTKGAIADEAAQKRLALALKNNAGATRGQVAATEAWITKQGKALGVADDELRPALGRLVTATKDVSKAQDLTSLAMDVSAGSGKSLKVVTEALMKAQNGQLAGLSKLGINVKNAEGDTISFTEATKRMSEQFGGQAAKNAETLEGKMRRLGVQWDEAKEAVGARLIPIVSKFADVMLTKAGPALQKAGNWARVNLAPPLQSVVGIVRGDLIPAMTLVGKVLLDVGGFILKHKTAAQALVGTIVALVAITKVHAGVMSVQAAGGLLAMFKATKLVSAVTKTYAAVQWLLNAALSANPIGLVVVGLAALAAAVVIAYKKSDTFRSIVQGAWKVIGTAARLYWNGYLKPVFGLLKKGFEAGADAAKAMRRGIGAAWEGIKKAAASATRWVVDKVLWMSEKVLDGAVAAFGWAPKIGDKLKAARDKVKQFREDVNSELNKVDDENVKVTVKAGVVGVDFKRPGGIRRARGGPVFGPGTGTSDSIDARLSNNEHVVTADEVEKAGGHGAIFAIRRMIKRGEFKRRGDVPAFAKGGPVFSLSTPGMGFLKGIGGLATRTLASTISQVKDRLLELWKSMGGAGKLSPSQIARGQRFARSQAGDPYVWGGVGPNGFDCSGFIGAVLNAALGQNPYSRRGTTASMPWGGFSPGKGSFSVGWFTGSPGHMAGRIGNMGIESAGGVGVRLGNAARGLSTFPNVAHYDNGGLLQPGWTLAYNGTGRPERIPNPRGGDYLGTVRVVVETEDGRVIQNKLLKLRRETRKPLGFD